MYNPVIITKKIHLTPLKTKNSTEQSWEKKILKSKPHLNKLQKHALKIITETIKTQTIKMTSEISHKVNRQKIYMHIIHKFRSCAKTPNKFSIRNSYS